jgi:F-type H+-transporting ATPase subunit a
MNLNVFFSPVEHFEILVMYPLSFLGLLDISITNSSSYISVIFFTVIALHFLGLYVTKIISASYITGLLEFFYQFIFGMIRQQSGVFGQSFFPYFFLTFWFILISNLLGLLPYGFTVTGHIIITFFLAFSFNLSFFLFGVAKHGFSFFKLFVPSGSPVFLIPLLVAIEILSYLLRTLSLSIRLFANMMAGHTLMFILSSFIISFFSFGFFGAFPAFLTFVLLFLIFALEIGIAFLQAYVFVILLTIYLRDGVSPAH